MYQVYCGTTLLYDPRIEDLTIIDPTVELELNKTGSFRFTLYPNHPYFDQVRPLKSLVTVKKEGRILFRGRAVELEEGFQKELNITCEGELAFLLDSRIRPFEFTGSPEAFLQKLLTEHNSQVEAEKQFKPGNVTVIDPNDYIARSNESCETAWENINSRLIKNLGGYLSVRHEEDGNYLDYLSDFPYMTTQRITFGENLLSFVKKRGLDEIATAIIPYGAKTKVEVTDPDTGEVKEEDGPRLTIESVNNELDYLVDETAAAKYGTIFTTEIWDDVTIAGNLLAKAQERLAELVETEVSIDLSAADLSLMEKSYDDFRLGEYVFVDSPPHEMNGEKFLISKQSIKLLSPAENTLTLGKNYRSFTEAQAEQNKTASSLVTVVEKIESNYVTNEVVNSTVNNVYSAINQTASELESIVSSQTEMGDSLTRLQTTVTQNAESITLSFEALEQQLSELEGVSETEFAEMKKYIRFEDGNIILGQAENNLSLKISSDRISFMQGAGEVAYISNNEEENKLYITDGQFLNSLQLGNFAFLPRPTGNLSFKWIGGDHN